MTAEHKKFLEIAREEAQAGEAEGGIATGAVLVKKGELISRSRDHTRQLNDPIAIAEMDCIRRAGRRIDYDQMTLYSTVVPNMLIAGTLLQFGVNCVVIGRSAEQSDGVKLLQSNHVVVTFVHE